MPLAVDLASASFAKRVPIGRSHAMSRTSATRRILAADNGARILVLTTFDLVEYVYEALRAGASGLVLKDDPPEQLLTAIRTVAQETRFCHPRSPNA